MFQECLFIIRISRRALIFLVYVGVTLGLGGCASTHWEFIAHMNQPRSGHTATRLNDGRVLVVGGPTGITASQLLAERYLPASSSWVYAGSSQVAHTRGTATVLQDGTVLVAGGVEYGSEADNRWRLGLVTRSDTTRPATVGWSSHS